MITRPLDEVVAIRKRPDGGAEVHVRGGFVLVLDDVAALALADDLTRACEIKLKAVMV